ncbi:tetratricopeptide repeat protein [Pseudaestuariivita sp.]|uniref:tetratricopeptide repeat protein n=1 Tax=Pseudaestuariivita sp. TaxID=2211669 RepID=UPI004058521B
MRHAIAFLALMAGPVLAETCPETPDRSAEVDKLYAELAMAPSEQVARPLNAQLWEIWLDAPDRLSQRFLDDGMRQRQYSNYVGAIINFDALVNYCPAYAEGYNQRAFANFLRADFEAALEDLDKALELQPRHLGAMSGKALTLMGLERDEEAQAVLRAALKLNPWMSERRFLKDAEGGPEIKL